MARERLLLAPVEVSGTAGWFLMDTGSSGSIVSPALGSQLEPSNGTHQLFGFGNTNQPVEVERVKTGRIRFADGRLQYPEELSVLDLGFLTDWAGAPVDGLLGWDVLREYTWGVDVRGGRLVAGRRLSPQQILTAFGVPRADATPKLKIIDDLPFVTVQVNGSSLLLMLDTGAQRTVFTADAWRRLGSEPLPDGALVAIRGVNGDNTGHLVHLARLNLGALAWTGLEVMVTDADNAADQDGLLGMDLLSQVLLAVDGPARTLYLANRPQEKD